MIPLLYDGAIGLRNVLTYCVYRAGLQFDITPENVVRKLIYQYLNVEPENRPISIPNALNKWLDEYDENYLIKEMNWDYRGFDPHNHIDKSYDPCDIDGESIIDTLVLPEELWDLAEEYYRLGQVSNLLHIRIPDVDSVIAIHKKLSVFDYSIPYAYAKFDKLQELYRRRNNLEKEDIEIYAGNLVLKSCIGKKKVGRINTRLFLARMVGCVREDDVTPDYLANNPKAAEVYKKYSDKDNFRRLMGRLRDGYVKYIEVLPGKPRYGYFFSFSRDLSKKEFENEIEAIIINDKKKSARNRKRLERSRKKMKCRKMVGLKVMTEQDKKKVFSNVPEGLPF